MWELKSQNVFNGWSLTGPFQPEVEGLSLESLIPAHLLDRRRRPNRTKKRTANRKQGQPLFLIQVNPLAFFVLFFLTLNATRCFAVEDFPRDSARQHPTHPFVKMSLDAATIQPSNSDLPNGCHALQREPIAALSSKFSSKSSINDYASWIPSVFTTIDIACVGNKITIDNPIRSNGGDCRAQDNFGGCSPRSFRS